MINLILFNEIVQNNREYILTEIPLYFRHSGRLFTAEDTICNKVETDDKSDDGLLSAGARLGLPQEFRWMCKCVMGLY